MRQIGEAIRRDSDGALSGAVGSQGVGWHEHWYVLSPALPRSRRPDRVMAPPTPDTDPLPRPQVWGPLGEEALLPEIRRPDLSSVDELADRIDDELIMNAMHVGGKAIERELVRAGAP